MSLYSASIWSSGRTRQVAASTISLVHLQYDVAILLDFVDVAVQSSLARLFSTDTGDEGEDFIAAELVFLMKLDALSWCLSRINWQDLEASFWAPHHKSGKKSYSLIVHVGCW